MKKLLTILFVLACAMSFAQKSTTPLYGDTILMTKRDGTASELKLMNGTKNVHGALVNTGDGITRFIKDTAYKLGDSIHVTLQGVSYVFLAGSPMDSSVIDTSYVPSAGSLLFHRLSGETWTVAVGSSSDSGLRKVYGLFGLLNVTDSSLKVDTATLGIYYLRISDTAAMLDPYLLATDTASLSDRINLKVNISDTSAMLDPYKHLVDTASNSSPGVTTYHRKDGTTWDVNATDTALIASIVSDSISTIPRDTTFFSVDDTTAHEARHFDYNSNTWRWINVPEVTTIDSSTSLQVLQGDTSKRISAGFFMPNIHADQCLTGCTVTWDSAYTYTIAASTYYINNIYHSSPAISVTLSPSDTVDNRIDLFVLQSDNTGGVVEGTPGNPAVEPDIDHTTQFKLSFAEVLANTTEPVITTTTIYKENAGTPTEFATSTNSVLHFNFNSTNFPYAGTKDIEGTTVQNGNRIILTASTTIDFTDLTDLTFKIQSKGNWGNNKKLVLQWYNGTTPLGISVIFGQSAYGFASNVTGTYQSIDIQLSDFGNITGADRLRMQASNGSGSYGFYMDNVELVSSTNTGNAGTLTVLGVAPISVTTVSNTSTVSLNNSGVSAGTYNNVTVSVKGIVTSGSNVTYITPSDTASMLSPYLRKADTTAMLLPYLRKTDTTAMLLPYLRKADTASMLSPYLRTAGDLSTLFTTTESSNNISFSGASTTQYTVLGRIASGSGAYSFVTADSTLIQGLHTQGYYDGRYFITADAVANNSTKGISTYDSNYFNSSSGLITVDTTNGVASSSHAGFATRNQIIGAIGAFANGNGVVIIAGSMGNITIPFNCTITNWYLAADVSGTIQFDIKRSGTSIVGGGNKPALSSAISGNAAVSGWTSTTVTAGDILQVVVDSSPAPATLTNCSMVLRVIKNSFYILCFIAPVKRRKVAA